MNNKVTLADIIWFLIGLGSFMALAFLTGAVILLVVLFNEWQGLLFVVPVAIAVWGVWAGLYMGIKHLRSRP